MGFLVAFVGAGRSFVCGSGRVVGGLLGLWVLAMCLGSFTPFNVPSTSLFCFLFQMLCTVLQGSKGRTRLVRPPK